jgi:hypothetical protein
MKRGGKVFQLLILSLILINFVAQARAATHYVRVDGSDTRCTGLNDAPYAGLGSAQPCAFKSPAKGANAASGGDTVYVGPGDYRDLGVQNITNPNMEPGIILLTAQDRSNKPKIKGFILNPGKGKGYLTLSYLEIDGQNDNNGIYIKNAKRITIDNNYVHHTYWAFIKTDPSCVTGLDDKGCYHSWDTVEDITITNNTFRWFHHTGFLLYGKNYLLENNDIALATCPGVRDQCDTIWPFGLNHTWRKNYFHHIATRYDGYSGSDFIQTFDDDHHALAGFLFERNKIVGIHQRIFQVDGSFYGTSRMRDMIFRNNLFVGIGATYGNCGAAGDVANFKFHNNTLVKIQGGWAAFRWGNKGNPVHQTEGLEVINNIHETWNGNSNGIIWRDHFGNFGRSNCGQGGDPCYISTILGWNLYFPRCDYSGNECVSKCTRADGIVDYTCSHDRNGSSPAFVNDTFIYHGSTHDWRPSAGADQSTTRIVLGKVGSSSSEHFSNGVPIPSSTLLKVGHYAEVNGDGVLRKIKAVNDLDCGDGKICTVIDIDPSQGLASPLPDGTSVLIWSTADGNITYDYRLTSKSGAKGYGLNLSGKPNPFGFSNDHSGKNRPHDSAWSIGAYE